MPTRSWGTRSRRKFLADQETHLPEIQGVSNGYYRERALEYIKDGRIKEAIRSLAQYHFRTELPPEEKEYHGN
jgi:hypothetical protein